VRHKVIMMDIIGIGHILRPACDKRQQRGSQHMLTGSEACRNAATPAKQCVRPLSCLQCHTKDTSISS
jgi:hypothetical protein